MHVQDLIGPGLFTADFPALRVLRFTVPWGAPWPRDRAGVVRAELPSLTHVEVQLQKGELELEPLPATVTHLTVTHPTSRGGHAIPLWHVLRLPRLRSADKRSPSVRSITVAEFSDTEPQMVQDRLGWYLDFLQEICLDSTACDAPCLERSCELIVQYAASLRTLQLKGPAPSRLQLSKGVLRRLVLEHTGGDCSCLLDLPLSHCLNEVRVHAHAPEQGFSFTMGLACGSACSCVLSPVCYLEGPSGLWVLGVDISYGQRPAHVSHVQTQLGPRGSPVEVRFDCADVHGRLVWGVC